MKSNPQKMLEEHQELVHSEMMKVISHVQRKSGDWIINSIMVEGCEVPFKFKRKGKYKNIKGQRVNLTYYSTTETVAGIDFDVMKVVRIRVS